MIRTLVRAAHVISMIFTPFCLPVVGMLVLFVFSYLSLLPWGYKGMVLAIVCIFTMLMPVVLITIYSKLQGNNKLDLSYKDHRMVPYVLSIMSYMCCVYVMRAINTPLFMSNIIIVALIIQVICAIINVWWKISAHMAAIGGFSGALLVFAIIFNFNPLWWFSLLILLSGILGTSRMILRQHTLAQVVGGYVTGFLCSMIMIFI